MLVEAAKSYSCREAWPNAVVVVPDDLVGTSADQSPWVVKDAVVLIVVGVVVALSLCSGQTQGVHPGVAARQVCSTWASPVRV